MATIWDTPNQGVGGWVSNTQNAAGLILSNGGKAGGAFPGSRLVNAQNTPTLSTTTESQFDALNPVIAQYKKTEPELYKKKYNEWMATRTDINNQVNAAVNFTALGAQKGGQIAAATANQNAVLAAQEAAAQKAREQAGNLYADSVANILAGRNNYANAVNQQQDVIQQAALGGWTGTAGALAGQQKAAQLGATDVLQDRAAKAQDIFATNSALAARTSQALATEFAMNEQDFNRQLGYNQQILASANQALQYATGEQKLRIQDAVNKYNNALSQYQNSASADKLNDDKSWQTGKLVLGALIGVASAVAAIPTAGATVPGIAVGAGIATG